MLNELAVLPSKEKGDNLDQYVFANNLVSPVIYMIDLRSGKIVKTWDFKLLKDIQNSYAELKAQQAAKELGDESFVQELYEEEKGAGY